MKTKFNKLITGAITTIAGLGVVGSIGGTYAWYTYNTKTTASIYGSSVSCTNNLQVKLNGEDSSNWRSDILSDEVNIAAGTDGTLKPVSSHDGGKTFRGMPISHSNALTAAASSDYYSFQISFREKVVGSNPIETISNNVYLTDVQISGNENIAPAVRMSFSNGGETWTLAPHSKSQSDKTQLYGSLDLDDNGSLDTQYTDDGHITLSNGSREYEWQKGYSTSLYKQDTNYKKGQVVIANYEGLVDPLDPTSGTEIKTNAFMAKDDISNSSETIDLDKWDLVKDTWAKGTEYKAGTHVRYLGKVYVAKIDIDEDVDVAPTGTTGTEKSEDYWTCKTYEIMYGASKLYDKTATSYSKGEYVYYYNKDVVPPATDVNNGKVFIAKEDITKANTFATDPDLWMEAYADYLGDSIVGDAQSHAITALENNPAGGRRWLNNDPTKEGKVIGKTANAPIYNKKNSYNKYDVVTLNNSIRIALDDVPAYKDTEDPDLSLWKVIPSEVDKYDSKASYSANAFVWYNGKAYIALEAIAIAGDFEPTKWAEVNSDAFKTTVTIKVWLEGWDNSITDLSINQGFQLGLTFETLY